MNERDLFIAALQITDQTERSAWLDRECAGDTTLRQRIDVLLQALDHAGSLLENPLVTPIGTGGNARTGVPIADSGSEAICEGPGTMIGPYKLLEKIGEGGFGTVFLAEQIQPVHRQVALKIIKPGMDSRQVVARFEAERQALAIMDHPNIAKVLDGGATGSGRPFFVMELVKGTPITTFCDQEQLTLQKRLELFIPVCQAVQHAHQKGIIHRDLKPLNVLIALYDGKPVPKVIDFGVAKAIGQELTERTMCTEVGQIVGTLEYMAPEQAELTNVDIDTRADIYSLGVILYELLAGSPPFARKQLRNAPFAEMLRLLREVEPPRPSTRLMTAEDLPAIAANRRLEPRKLRKQVQGDLDWIAMKCLEKERNRRYETALGVAFEIQRFLADEPVLAGPPSGSYRLRKFVRRHKGPVLAAALVLLTLIVGVAVSSWQAFRATQAESNAIEGWAAEAERRREAEIAQQLAKANEELALEQKHKADLATEEAYRQKQEAEDKAAITRAVNQFVQKDLLEQADIGTQALLGTITPRNPNITVRELLDRAALALPRRFAEQPLTEAAIRHTLGRAYLAIGRYGDATKHLERSIVLRTARHGLHHFDTLLSMHDLGVVLNQDGRLEAAEKLTLQVLEAQAKLLGPRHADTLSTSCNLGMVYLARGKYGQAEKLLQETVDIQVETLGADAVDTMDTMVCLAELHRIRGRYGHAESMYEKVLEANVRHFGADHPKVMSAKNNLALVYYTQGKFPQAERLLKETLEYLIAKQGADHPHTLISKDNLATVYHHLGKLDLAEALHKEVVEGLTAKHGRDHRETLVAIGNLAMVYHAQQQYEAAERLNKEALEAQVRVVGPTHPETLRTKGNLGATYRKQGKYDLAVELCREVLDAQTQQLGADNPVTLVTRGNLAALYWSMRRFDLSVPIFEEVLPAIQRKLPADHPDTLNIAVSLAVNYRDSGRLDDAARVIEEWLPRCRTKYGPAHAKTETAVQTALSIYERLKTYSRSESLLRDLAELRKEQHGAESSEYASRLALLGLNLFNQKRPADGESVLRACLAIREKREPDKWLTYSTKSVLGETLLQQKKYAEAEPFLLAGYQGLNDRQAQMAPEGRRNVMVQALNRLVRLYEALEEPEKAAEWRKKLDAAREAKKPDPPGNR
jgi:serine/threonine protein kinase/Flp pilus assembly protein TadD